jgi:hypothetical protein
MIWAIVNIVSGLIVCLIVSYKMGAYPEKFTFPEMAGMGMIATSMLLRVGGPILSREVGGDSPFDDWSVTMLHVGLATYFTARMVRHQWNNMLMKRDARQHLQSRSKL